MKKQCFVVQGFGVKTDLQNNRRKLDLESSYLMLKEAVEKAGLNCLRADDIIHSGQIDIPMYKQLDEADLVIVDLSTANLNAAFELGVRYTLRRRTTIVVAENGFKTPFNISQINILRYKHEGNGVLLKEAKDFQEKLITFINEIMRSDGTDSPVYNALQYLHEPGKNFRSTDTQQNLKLKEEPIVASNLGVVREAYDYQDVVQLKSQTKDNYRPSIGFMNHEPSIAGLQTLAEAAMKTGEFAIAKRTWEQILGYQPNNDHAIRQFAFATAKAKEPTVEIALNEAKQILQKRGLLTSTTDPDTFALWGFFCKRSWDLASDINDLSASISAYQRAYSIRQHYRDGIILSVLFERRSNLQIDSDERVADKILAKRIRADIINAEFSRLENNTEDNEKRSRVLETLWLVAQELAVEEVASNPGANRVINSSESYHTWMSTLYSELNQLVNNYHPIH